MIPMHAVATDDPQRTRWVVDHDRLPAAGRVRHAPGRLGALRDAGVIDELTVAGSEIAITLSPQQSWRARGEEIRAALDEALREPAGWRVEPSERTSEMARAAEELLSGPIGELAASHGGAIELVGVTGDQVRVRTSGACHGCLASESTLYDRLQRELRRRFGDQVTVSVANTSTAVSVGKKLLTLFVR
ncbi:nitrogen fixation protein NifU [Mycolicibacter heraklionensis]|uniref:Nitrogen fixation protein NifU n=1 Tax=Mycolicibacter heraklionensis TaxID=512402 RepID=A0ABR5FJA5_9MYCO|nr:NifU family protein [Mycolicibacter heraklionensis]KLO30994.1 nitrogen fixation protein NifU [Mycolicibacter heraklionensis]